MTENPPLHERRRTMRSAALKVVQCLQAAGHTAYFAGGCVRDMLMGRRPHDFDVATSALPKQVVELFRRTRQVGAQFGVVLVRIAGYDIEVATFRADIDYEDGRHPTHVRFTDAREDAQRRDFTINGMFYDPVSRKVVDYVGGQEDLSAGVLRAIGEPSQRFEEDHLRILRAIRFSARLGFPIERGTWSAMCASASEIRRISPERIREELDKMLTNRNRSQACRDLFAAGVVPHLWPRAEVLLPHREAIQGFVSALPVAAPFELGLAAILHPLSTKQVEAACLGLRCSNQVKKTVVWLVGLQDIFLDPSRVTRADLKLLMAHPAFHGLLTLFGSKLRAKGLPPTAHRRISTRARRIPPEDVAPPPWVNGDFLEELKLPKGPAYSAILERVYYAQLNGDLADRAAAREYARQLVAERRG